MNLFPEIDSSWYIDNSSEKHNSMEFHAYKSMATYCLSHHFMHEKWNHQLDRRSAIIKSRQIDKKNFRDILITPMRVLSIDLLQDKCIDGLDESLIYKIEPEEQEVTNLNFFNSKFNNFSPTVLS